MPASDVENGSPRPDCATWRRRRWIVIPVLLLCTLAAYLFNKAMGAAAFYSAWGPITSTTPADKISELAYADRRAQVFFLYSAAVVGLAALLLACVIRLRRVGLAGYGGIVARYVLALAMCLVATSVFVWVLAVLRLG